MQLTETQRQTLHLCRRYRDRGGPRVTDLLRRQLALYTAVALLLIPGVYFSGTWWLAALVVGLLIGRLRADVTNALIVVRQWPTIAEVVDWQRVDKLLAIQSRPVPSQALGR